jgi:predicted phosphoribosyltransferase
VSILFDDRKAAGDELAKKLGEYLLQSENIDYKELENMQAKESLLVLAIPRGGVVLGDVIASYLQCCIDIVVSRKIGAPSNKELAIGAVMPDGIYFINENLVKMLNVSEAYIQSEVQAQKKEIERRLMEFRGITNYKDILKDKIVILVDDGIATGSTILAAARWIKEGKHECKKLIIAVPVAPAKDDTIEKLNKFADKVIILYIIEEFYAVGQFYKRFEQVTDGEVKAIMSAYV